MTEEPEVLADPEAHISAYDELRSEGELTPSAGEGGLRNLLTGWATLRFTPWGLRPLYVLGFVGLAQAFDDSVYNVAGPTFVQHRGLSITNLTNVLSVIGFLAIFANLGIGYYAERGRRSPLVGLGAVISGVSSAFSGFMRSNVSLGVTRAIDSGVGTNVGGVPVFGLLSDYYPSAVRGRAFTLLSAFGNFGQLLALPLGALLLEDTGLEKSFLIIGVFLVVTGIVAGVVLREPTRGGMERLEQGLDAAAAAVEEEPLSFGESWRAIFAVKTVRRLFVGDLISGLGAASQVFTVFLLVQHYHLTTFQLGLFAVPQLVTALIARALAGTAVDRLLSRDPSRALQLYGLSFAASAVGVLALAFEPPIALLIVVQCLIAAGGSLVGPAASAVYSQVVPPRTRTLGTQVTGLAAAPGFLIFIPLMGVIFNKYGFQTVYLTAAPAYFVAGLVYATSGSFFEGDHRNALESVIAGFEWVAAKAKGDDRMLVARNVDVGYDGVQVLFGVDFDVREGEIVALLGTNGAGKSTLLRAISGTQEASGGAIVFEGRDTTHMPPHEIARRNLVHMPGGRGVFPDLTVRENLQLATWTRDDADQVKIDLADTLKLFPAVRARLDSAAGTLSGGEQQQVSLCQAMLMKPRLLLIDELSLGLSPAVVGELIEVVKAINATGVSVVVVEQSVTVALELADRAVFLEKGEVRFSGPTQDLLDRPDILRAVYVKGTGGGGAATAVPRQVLANPVDRGVALEVVGLTKAFGGVKALNDVSLTLYRDEVLGIIGPNGSGKTTLFDVTSGYIPADSGAVIFDGTDITSMSPEERAKIGLVRRFQDARLFPSLTVHETVLIALERQTEVRSTWLTSLATPPARREERKLRARADELVEMLSLGDFRNKPVGALSTGLRRITDIACVMASDPDVLLLDEPSTGIAQAEAEGLAALLRRVRNEAGCAIMIIEHDIPLISAVADELMAMNLGSVLMRGAVSDVLSDDRVVASYLGTSDAAINRSGGLT